MPWDNIIESHREEYGRNYLLCKEEKERDFLINLLMLELKSYSKQEIDLALGYACRTISDKGNLQLILDCVKENVGRI